MSRSVGEREFAPLVLNAHYPSIERGLAADVLATRALRGQAFTACTGHIVASHGTVTDVLNVPTDTIGAQLDHIFSSVKPTGVKIGILGHPATINLVFDRLNQVQDPIIWDVTLSGPSGEDIIGQDGIDAIGRHLGDVTLVSLRKNDAELLAGMEIPSLDDAQVALQRLAHNGARAVLLRCGQIATHHFDTESPAPDFSVDLLYDGEEFSLFEAPLLNTREVHGASSALLMAALRGLIQAKGLAEAIQHAKGYTTEALRRREALPHVTGPNYFWNWNAPAESNGAAT